MSSLWTPSGEHPVAPPVQTGPSTPIRNQGSEQPASGQADPTSGEEELSDAEMAAIRDQLLNTPIEALVANHAVGLYELAAFYLSLDDPMLHEASLALDGLAGLLDTLGPRLGPYEAQLRAQLTQLRLYFVKLAEVAGWAST